MASRERLGLACDDGCWDFVRMEPQRVFIARNRMGKYLGFVYCPQCMAETEMTPKELFEQETEDG